MAILPAMKKRSVLFAALALMLPGQALAALPVGAKAPDFTTRGALAGKTFTLHLAAQLKNGPVVLYFFPAAFTPGCTIEAHEFAEASDAFRKAGATIIGLSADPIEKLQKFSIEACRNKFAVATAAPAVISAYDVTLPLRQGLSNRTSYVISQSGRIAYVHSDLNPADHVKNSLAAVKSLQGKTGR